MPGDLWMGQEDFPVKTTKSAEEYKTTYGMFALLSSPILLGADMLSLQREPAAGETVILITPPCTFTRCFNMDAERVSAK